MTRTADTLLTALAPAIWGTTYIVTTELLPPDHPLTLALLRGLPAGLLLLLWVRQVPGREWWGRVLILGAFNFSIFWTLLFVAAVRLPGGVAATVAAIQPLIVVLLARALMATPLRPVALVAAVTGMAGVALLILTPAARLDPIGILAGLGGALSMAMGTVLTRKWQPPVPALTFTAWQLTAGGLLLLPVVLVVETPLPPLTPANWAGFLWLSVFGAALSYALWFRGIARLGPSAASLLGFLSPTSAVLLGWVLLDQSLGLAQVAGVVLVLASVALGQRTG